MTARRGRYSIANRTANPNPKHRKPIMPKFTVAPDEVAQVLAAVIGQYYPELEELTNPEDGLPALRFDLCFAYAETNANGDPKSAALTLHGSPCAAIIKRIGLKDRAMGRADVEIAIDALEWAEMTLKEQTALLDHELYHLEPKKEDDGTYKRDDLGRPLFGMRHHDFQVGWFAAVAARHKSASIEQKQARAVFDEFGQAFFPFVKDPAPGKVKKRKAPEVVPDEEKIAA